MEIITKRLFEMRDLKYRDFTAKLIPNVEKERIIGIRSPAMKAYCKELREEDYRLDFIKELPHYYLEENSLHASIIASISKDINVVIKHIEEFLPYVDNWATCDIMPPKLFAKYPETVYPKILEWLGSRYTFTVRFGLVCLLSFFLEDNYKTEINGIVASIKTDEYYINIAIAWYYSYALIKQYETTIPFFETPVLGKWVHNKSIQKAIESYRISEKQKDYLRGLRLKR